MVAAVLAEQVLTRKCRILRERLGESFGGFDLFGHLLPASLQCGHEVSVMHAVRAGYTWAVCGLLIFCGAILVYSRMIQRIPKGEWGGTHISMNVSDQSATIEYDCAHGEIPGPLNIDGEGKFQLPGTFTPERGGPIRADDAPQAQHAKYTGTIKGNTMTLTLKIGDSDDTETFTLEKDKQGKLFKCK